MIKIMPRVWWAWTLGVMLCAGCTSAQLAKDEAAALAGLYKIDAAISSGAAAADVKALSAAVLATDPGSPALQRIDAKVQAATDNPQAQADAQVAARAGIVLLQIGQAATPGQ